MTGALRYLRHLVLGTSCALGFAVCVTIDDCRRLKCTVHSIRSNTQKLKSLKRYNTTSANAIKAFVEKAVGFQDDESITDKLPPNFLPKTPRNGIDKSLTTDKISSEPRNVLHKDLSNVMELHSLRKSALFCKLKTKQIKARSTCPFSQSKNGGRSVMKLESLVTSLLESHPPRVMQAANIFLDTIINYKNDSQSLIQTIQDRTVLNLALSIFRACKKESMYDYSHRIFHEIIHKCIEENILIPSQLRIIIEKLLKRVSPKCLDEAVSIYLATLNNFAEFGSSQLLDLGQKLCEISFTYRKYLYTQKIFDKMRDYFVKFPYESLGYFIMSVSNDKEYHPQVFEYFVKYYPQALSSEPHNNKIVRALANHLLAHRKFAEAERVIAIALEIAKKAAYPPPSTPCLFLLRKDWDTFQDLDKTIALFDRVKDYVHHVRCPWIFYEMMIKICIEIEDSTSAWLFYTKSQKYTGPRLGSFLAEFTLLKAKRGDSDGVEDDFKNIKQPEVAGQYSKLFPKILKHFSSKNKIVRTGKLIELAVKVGVLLTLRSINKIADIYAREKDFESIIRLLQYMTSLGFVVDSVFINTILKHSYDTWRLKIDKVFEFIESIMKLDAPSPIVDINTFLILRRIVLSKRRVPISWKSQTLERLNCLFKPYKLERKDPYSPPHLLWEMVAALNLDDPAEALEIFDWAQLENIRTRSEHLNVAVEASFRLNNGNLYDGLQRIHKSGLHSSQTVQSVAILFVHQLQQLAISRASSSDEIIQLTQQFISGFEKRGLEIPLQVITQTLSTLERLHNFPSVTTYWNSVAPRLKLTLASLNLETLTIFLKTYIRLRDIRGFWQVLHILVSNRIFPDHHFRLVIQNARRKVLIGLRIKGFSRQEKLFLDTLLQGRALIDKLRQEARSQRDIGSSKMIENIKENLHEKLRCIQAKKLLP